ncbi:hypothetical protein, partial [Clostridium perfringens]
CAPFLAFFAVKTEPARVAISKSIGNPRVTRRVRCWNQSSAFDADDEVQVKCRPPELAWKTLTLIAREKAVHPGNIGKK